ncbi:MAG: hypothetical protein MJ102_07690 [Clostridia bacterium]|nr:hypothetical protein [Clostridia bacterium]
MECDEDEMETYYDDGFGSLKRGDSEMLAFACTAPISTPVRLCDREPEKIEGVLIKIKAFIEHFFDIYGERIWKK